jgi:hypothetical protein
MPYCPSASTRLCHCNGSSVDICADESLACVHFMCYIGRNRPVRMPTPDIGFGSVPAGSGQALPGVRTSGAKQTSTVGRRQAAVGHQRTLTPSVPDGRVRTEADLKNRDGRPQCRMRFRCQQSQAEFGSPSCRSSKDALARGDSEGEVCRPCRPKPSQQQRKSC